MRRMFIVLIGLLAVPLGAQSPAPSLQVSYRQFTLLAVGHEYVPPDHELRSGDELCLFPPVSGGGAARGRWPDATPVGAGPVAFTLVAALLAALSTEAIGIHAIFGAFLLGAMIPHDSRVARAVRSKTHDVVTILLLPALLSSFAHLASNPRSFTANTIA